MRKSQTCNHAYTALNEVAPDPASAFTGLPMAMPPSCRATEVFIHIKKEIARTPGQVLSYPDGETGL